MSVGERRAEALAVLRRSRLISEEGIGATWGEPATDIKSASAAIRAWRPIQVSGSPRAYRPLLAPMTIPVHAPWRISQNQPSWPSQCQHAYCRDHRSMCTS